MDRVFYTLFTGNKYPAWYPAMVAKSLEPWGCRLVCVTDHDPETLVQRPNLSYVRKPGLPPGWWGKLEFFNSSFLSVPVVFIDLDSVCIRDPGAIFEWLGKRRPAMAFCRDHLGFEKISTAMFFCNPTRKETEGLWKRVVAGKTDRFKGDQQMVHHFLVGKEGFLFFPKHFMVSYKAIHDSMWRKMERNIYDEFDRKNAIFWTFNGHPWPHEVVKKQMESWEKVLPFIEDLTC